MSEHPTHFPRGNWATLMLPINTVNAIDFARLDEEILTLVGFGVDGIYSNGTAGEFYNQTEQEFDRVQALLARRCRNAPDGGMPFQIGVSHVNPTQSLERLRRTLRHEPSAFQVILPDWVPTVEAEQIAFLRRLAAKSETVRLVLYHPPHAKVRLTPAEFGRLKDAVPQLIGVKVPGGDPEWYAEMRQHMAGLSVFVPGHFLATGMREGAHGAYSNVACLHPRAAQDWYGLMGSDLPAALETEVRIQRFMREHIAPYITEQRYPNAAADKFMAVVGGWANVGARLRWPYRGIPEAEAAAVRAAARTLLPEFFRESLKPTP